MRHASLCCAVLCYVSCSTVTIKRVCRSSSSTLSRTARSLQNSSHSLRRCVDSPVVAVAAVQHSMVKQLLLCLSRGMSWGMSGGMGGTPCWWTHSLGCILGFQMGGGRSCWDLRGRGRQRGGDGRKDVSTCYIGQQELLLIFHLVAPMTAAAGVQGLPHIYSSLCT